MQGVARAGADFDLGLFRIKNPFSSYKKSSLQNGNQEECEKILAPRDKDYLKLFSFATNLEEYELRNYYGIRFIVAPNKIMLDTGEVVNLVGLMSADEITMFSQNPYNVKLIKTRHIKEVIIDFMQRYLKDRKLTVKIFEDLPTDSQGDRYAFVYLPSGELINLSLLSFGYGLLSNRYYFDKYSDFKGAETTARLHSRGIWQ